MNRNPENQSVRKDVNQVSDVNLNTTIAASPLKPLTNDQTNAVVEMLAKRDKNDQHRSSYREEYAKSSAMFIAQRAQHLASLLPESDIGGKPKLGFNDIDNLILLKIILII